MPATVRKMAGMRYQLPRLIPIEKFLNPSYKKEIYFLFSKKQKIKWLIRCSVMECMLLSHTAGQYKSTFEAWSVLIVCSLQNKKAACVL